MNKGIDAKPHIRYIDGYWRVSAVPVKWCKLSEETQRRFRRAHDAVHRENAKLDNKRAKTTIKVMQ